MPDWFASRKPARHYIVFPGAKDVAEDMRAKGRDEAEIAAFLEDNTFWVEVRELTAGDRAHLDELRLGDEGAATLSYGNQILRAVELCLTSWSLPEPPTAENVRQLKPLVVQAIFEALDDGRMIVEKRTNGSEGANGSGPPRVAPVVEAQPDRQKDTALIE